jgi:MFS family permease
MKSKLLGHSANDLFWFIIPLILPTLLIRYDLNFTQAGGILTTYLVVLAICSFAIGKLSDLFSRRTILSYGFFLASLGLSASAFAPSLAVFLILINSRWCQHLSSRHVCRH